jgi:2-C-methyl-D-erythritol 4-phosphate cytidylyltransferase
MNNVIIVAGGKGLRMGGDFPKQFIAIDSVPILIRTIDAFYNFDNQIKIIVVLPASFKEHWQRMCKGYGFSIKHEIVNGGDTRFESVKNGLTLIESGWVAVHDAVRPFASKALISECFRQAAIHKAVVPVVEVVDSMRELTGDEGSRIVDRSRYRLIQTPQVFDADLLKKAYEQPFNDAFTDDASVVEAYGHPVHLVDGERTNIKITTPFDLTLAEVIAKS